MTTLEKVLDGIDFGRPATSKDTPPPFTEAPLLQSIQHANDQDAQTTGHLLGNIWQNNLTDALYHSPEWP